MKLLKILAMTLLVSSCGFQPLYVQRDNSSSWYFSDKFDTSIVEESDNKCATICWIC